jgi:ribonuclease J
MIAKASNELLFLPLGGVGEIGMNLALYGYGPRHAPTWLAVDFGVSFAHADLPGVDLVFPDIAFIEARKASLAGIVITHAHEDHFGALIDLWPRLGVPICATAFTAGLLSAKLASEPGVSPIPVNLVKAGQRVTVGPFDVEYINVTHSIPESHALAIRTPLGTVLHSGDWKLDPEPAIGEPTDVDRLKAVGSEGVLALVSDSTNAMREGRSPSEGEVARALVDIVRNAKGRVAFTTFASNIGRVRSIARAAQAAGRDVVISGRALRRAIDVATELGMMDDMPPFLDEDAFQHLPREKVVAILTGSQGEPRASLAKVASGEHPRIQFAPGDMLVYSAREIPGNELDVDKILNALTTLGVHVVTDRDRLVHTSGHPRRDEMRELYGWIKPKVAIPVHGQPMHLAAHADLARAAGVETVLSVLNGKLVKLAPGAPEVVEGIEAGRLYKDGKLVGTLEDVAVAARRKLSFVGHIGVSIVIDNKGNQIADPDIAFFGVPEKTAQGPMEDAVLDALHEAIESMPRPQRRDPDVLQEAVRRAVRAAVAERWGKKPVCTVFVAVV